MNVGEGDEYSIYSRQVTAGEQSPTHCQGGLDMLWGLGGLNGLSCGSPASLGFPQLLSQKITHITSKVWNPLE